MMNKLVDEANDLVRKEHRRLLAGEVIACFCEENLAKKESVASVAMGFLVDRGLSEPAAKMALRYLTRKFGAIVWCDPPFFAYLDVDEDEDDLALMVAWHDASAYDAKLTVDDLDTFDDAIEHIMKSDAGNRILGKVARYAGHLNIGICKWSCVEAGKGISIAIRYPKETEEEGNDHVS